MSVLNATFSVIDYIVLIGTLIVSTAIGVYFRFSGGKQSTTKEYLMGDRNQKILPVAISSVTAHISSISMLGIPAEVYFRGFHYAIINVSLVLVIPMTAHLYLPVFFKVGSASAYEYLEKRFGKCTRVVAAVTFPLQAVLTMGLALYAPALVLEALTSLPRTWSICLVGFVCTFYSYIGGIKAVIMTDVFQFLLTTCAIFSIVLSAYADRGSFSEIWDIAVKGNRTDMFNFSMDPTERHTWWSLTLGGWITYMSSYAVHQMNVQRYLTMKDHKTAAKCLYLSWPITVFSSLALSFTGLCIYSRYANCDPFKLGKITSQDQLLPFYVMDALGHLLGVPGLIVAGIFSASLSSISASMNSLATVTLEDYVKPVYVYFRRHSLPEKNSIIVSKFLVLFYGILLITVAYTARYIAGILQTAITVAGVIGGPMITLFTLGLFVPSANEPGAIASIVSSTAMAVWLSFGGPKPPVPNLPVTTKGCATLNMTAALHSTFPIMSTPLAYTSEGQYPYFHRISYLWNIVLASITGIICGYLVSWYAQKFYRILPPSDPDLFSPPVSAWLRKKKLFHDVNGDEVVIFQKNVKADKKEEPTANNDQHTS